jgi:hypothetical protein
MTVRVRDLSAIRRAVSSLIAFSVGFEGVYQGIVLTPQAIMASGGIPPYSFSAVGLPTGVTINAVTGIISGTPTVFGNFTATVTVTDNAGNSINVSAFFSIIQTAFSDDFNRANSTDLGSNWIRSFGNNTSAGGVGSSWGTAQITAGNPNRCSLIGAGPNNPTGTLYTAWLPIPVMASLYNQPKTFAQATFISTTVSIAAAIAVRYNEAHEAGPITTPNGCDAYVITLDGQTIRLLNGSAAVNIGPNSVPIVAGNVLRLEVENTGADLILISRVNGAIVNNNTILAAATPITKGMPCFILRSVGGAPPTAQNCVFDDFSCGVF